MKVRAVLFDLDGTLADTAPDLAAAVNLMRLQRNLEPVPLAKLRIYASGGARGLLDGGFDITPEHDEFESMRAEFLGNYAAAICEHTRLFDGITELLNSINQQSLPWGIVTNKPSRFTQALLPLLDLQQARCVVSGDTTPHFKPHPASLLEAARQLQVLPQECCYLGDDLRDIQAAQAAGMVSIGVTWGYCGKTEPNGWKADLLLDQPGELLKFI